MTADPGNRLVGLEGIPCMGPAIAADLRTPGIGHPADLAGRDRHALYEQLDADTGIRHDPYVLDTFIGSVRCLEGGPRVPRWTATEERKRTLSGIE